MSKVYRTYTREVYDHLRYRPSWLPNTPMTLGSVGVLEDGIFRPMTDLARLGIDAAEFIDSVADGALDFASQTGVSIHFKAAGQAMGAFRALATADAGALLEFSKKHAVVMQLRGVSSSRIADQPLLERQLMRALVVGSEAERWQRDWVVVTDVVRAETATIAISNSGDSRLELKASGKVAPANLADASAGLTVAAESQVGTRVISEAGLTPLFRGLRVRRNFWWLYDEVQPASADAPEPAAVFAEADPADDAEATDGESPLARE